MNGCTNITMEYTTLKIFLLALNVFSVEMKSLNLPEKEAEKETDTAFGNNEKCDTIKYKQVISLRGCKNMTIDNHYCQGQCFSGYVPENGVNGKYTCSSCKPTIEIMPINLECEDGKKLCHIEIFKNCQCIKTKCQIVLPIESPSSQTSDILSRPPCQSICRRCRRSRRRYDELLDRKIKVVNLKMSCRSEECKKRISERIFVRTKRKKKQKRKLCKECRTCKANKRNRK